jgi:hypothetical protein
VGPAERLLRALGYQLGQVEELLGTPPKGPTESPAAEALTRRFYERFHYELPFDAPRGGALLPVDLHWHVAPASQWTVSVEQLWAQTLPVVIGDIQLITLNPPATLIHLAVHATTCALAGFRLLHLCDVAWAATRWSEHADGLWALAETWGVAAHLGAVLDTVDRGLGVPIPAAIRRRRSSFRPALSLVATEAFLVDSHQEPEESTLQRLWAEVAWNVAMRCLRWNVTRAVRVRLVRARWRLFRWRHRQTV